MSGAHRDEERGNASAFGKLPPGPHRLPRELVRENQRHRLLQAALDVFSERGYTDATVQDLLRAAHVSRATFYEIFPDKEACLAVLYEELVTSLRVQVEASAAGVPRWPDRIRAVVKEVVETLADDPRIASICTIEAPYGPAAVLEHHAQVLGELSGALRAGRGESPRGEELPDVLESALVCGAIYVVGRSVVFGQGPEPGELIAELPELLLLPYRA